MKAPQPHSEAFNLYWQSAATRQHIFEQRMLGAPPPWTDDPIFNEYKFCNVYRASDRVSQYLIKDVIEANKDTTPADRLLQIVLFRTFSHIDTWEALVGYLEGPPTIDALLSGDVQRGLDHVLATRHKLYTGAFILCATKAYGHPQKHHNHCALFKDMFIHRPITEALLNATSLETVYTLLHQFPLMGDFMSYQIAIDINYSSLINFSENDFVQPGPGAVRGLKKIFDDLGDYSAKDTIMWLVDQQESQFARLGLTFNGLYGRPMHAIDCQNWLCETDKYCRVALPDLASNRKRIKARYTQGQILPKPFYPPKWQLKIMTDCNT